MSQKADISSHDVIEFLTKNPSFFEEHGLTVLKKMNFTESQDTTKVVDLKGYFIKKLQESLEDKEEMQKFLIEVSRLNLHNQNRVHKVVVEIIQAKSLSDLFERITVDTAIKLGIDLVALCIEDHGQLAGAALQYITPIAKGTVEKVLPAKQKVVLRNELSFQDQLYPQAEHLIKSDAIAKLSLTDYPAILVLASRREDMFHPSQGTEHLLFLTKIIEVQLEKCLKVPANSPI